MEEKDAFLAILMIMSSLVLAHRWLTRIGESDIVIIISAMILIGSLSAMILLLDARLRNLEENIDDAINAKERSIRISIQGIEENIGKKMESFMQKTNNLLNDFSKKIYR